MSDLQQYISLNPTKHSLQEMMTQHVSHHESEQKKKKHYTPIPHCSSSSRLSSVTLWNQTHHFVTMNHFQSDSKESLPTHMITTDYTTIGNRTGSCDISSLDDPPIRRHTYFDLVRNPSLDSSNSLTSCDTDSITSSIENDISVFNTCYEDNVTTSPKSDYNGTFSCWNINTGSDYLHHRKSYSVHNDHIKTMYSLDKPDEPYTLPSSTTFETFEHLRYNKSPNDYVIKFLLKNGHSMVSTDKKNDEFSDPHMKAHKVIFNYCKHIMYDDFTQQYKYSEPIESMIIQQNNMIPHMVHQSQLLHETSPNLKGHDHLAATHDRTVQFHPIIDTAPSYNKTISMTAVTPTETILLPNTPSCSNNKQINNVKHNHKHFPTSSKPWNSKHIRHTDTDTTITPFNLVLSKSNIITDNIQSFHNQLNHHTTSSISPIHIKPSLVLPPTYLTQSSLIYQRRGIHQKQLNQIKHLSQNQCVSYIPSSTTVSLSELDHIIDVQSTTDMSLFTNQHIMNNNTNSCNDVTQRTHQDTTLQHPTTCKPCAFFWTKGCINGDSCQFCHEWHAPKKKKPMKDQKNLMIIARPDGKIEFLRCTIDEALKRS